MSDVTKEYSNGEVTVVWKPGMCIHSAKCVEGLPEVFRPKEKPWIKPDAASTESVINQVKSCPSGALSYYMNGEEVKVEEKVEDISIEVIKNGPLIVFGALDITHCDGRIEKKETRASFCRCGHSENKPFCDGAHKRKGFEG